MLLIVEMSDFFSVGEDINGIGEELKMVFENMIKFCEENGIEYEVDRKEG